AEKGMMRLLQANKLIDNLKTGTENSTFDLNGLLERCYNAMNEDLNTPMVIAELHDAARMVNLVNDGKESISGEQRQLLKNLFDTFLTGILAVVEEETSNTDKLDTVMQLVIQLRNEARANKDFK